jgi:4-hydroxybenzoate polyprenyltransferase
LPKKVFEQGEYAKLGIFCFLLALIGALSLGFSFAALIFVYQFLAWLYSSATFRLKRFLGVATFVSAIASLMILFLGYILLSNDQTLSGLSWRVILLLLITYTLSLPIKDFKDIEGDKKDGVFTLPVVLGEKKGRLVLSVNIFISYMLSVFFINELDLFFWALAFGVVTFLLITNEKIKPRKLPGWTLAIISTYTFILVRIVFF